MISKVVAKSVANLMGAAPKVMSVRGGPAGVPVLLRVWVPSCDLTELLCQ